MLTPMSLRMSSWKERFFVSFFSGRAVGKENDPMALVRQLRVSIEVKVVVLFLVCQVVSSSGLLEGVLAGKTSPQ